MPKRQQQAFVCIGKSPAEQFYLSKQFDPDATCCHGPFHGMGNLHRAVETLNRLFLLRDCNQKTPMLYSDQLQLFDLELRAGCVRQEIGTCLAPCLRSCSRHRYAEQVDQATQFLNGASVDVLTAVEQRMIRAAAGHHFEHAARMRDDFKILKWLSNRLASFKRAREQYSFIYSVRGCDGRDIWYLIRKGGIEHAIAAPKNASQWRCSRSELTRWHETSESAGTGFLRYEESIGFVTTWFQKNRKELLETRAVAEIPTRWSEMNSAWTEKQLTVG